MIPLRGYLIPFAAGLVLVGIAKCHAEEGITPRHQRPSPTACKFVRDMVALVGEAEAERTARAGGLSEDRIRAGRQCLKDGK